MRDKLGNIGSEKRHTFVGIFERYGTKNGYMGQEETVLLKDIKEVGTDKIVTNHLWFNCTQGFELANPTSGDVLQFDARVTEYQKGYRGYRENVFAPISWDYKLERPTRVRNLTHPERSIDKKTMQKRRQDAYDAQRREQEAIWEEEKRRRSLITDAQEGFIQTIAETLGIDKPDIEKKADASDWIDAHIGEYQKKHKEIQAAKRAEEHKERLHQASSLRESGLGTKDIATEMGLTPGTIRKYLKEIDSKKIIK